MDEQVGLRVLAFRTQNVLADKAIQQVLQFAGIVRSVDDEALVLVVELGLRAEFTAEELGWVGWRAVEGLCDIAHVGDDGLDAVSLAFDFGADAGHLVARTKRNLSTVLCFRVIDLPVVQISDFTVHV